MLNTHRHVMPSVMASGAMPLLSAPQIECRCEDIGVRVEKAQGQNNWSNVVHPIHVQGPGGPGTLILYAVAPACAKSFRGWAQKDTNQILHGPSAKNASRPPPICRSTSAASASLQPGAGTPEASTIANHRKVQPVSSLRTSIALAQPLARFLSFQEVKFPNMR